MNTFRKQDKQMAKLIQEAYKSLDSRSRIFKSLQYKKEKSSPLWCWYEDDEEILIGIHGANDIKLNEIAIKQFFNPESFQKEIDNFCLVHKNLPLDKKVHIAAHSLGTWVLTACEMFNRKKTEATLFGPYVPSKEAPRSKFMASNSRFRKIFYDNDFFANNLLKIKPLHNALIMTPKSIPFTFINGHSISNFSDSNLELLNVDVKKYIPALKDFEKVEKQKEEPQTPKSTTLTIMSYNVKMLNPLIANLKSKARAVWIPEEIENQYPNVEVLFVMELFDTDAEKIFDVEMGKRGFGNSKVVSHNNFSHFKVENGGVKIYSKHPFSDETHTTYRNSDKEDALAGKGAIRITIKKDGIPINLIATHLQSGRKSKAVSDKRKQFNQLNEKLVKEESITIIGGDMNINLHKQNELLDDVIDTNELKVFPIDFSKGRASVDTDFTNPKADAKNWLDYFFYKPNQKFLIKGTILKSPLKKPGGFLKPEEERVGIESTTTSFKHTAEDVGQSIKGAFKKKKQRRRARRRLEARQKAEKTRRAFDLSDHHPIIINLRIRERPEELSKQDLFTEKESEIQVAPGLFLGKAGQKQQINR